MSKVHDKWLEHEALDRTSNLLNIMHVMVGTHEVIHDNQELRKKYDQAYSLIHDIYQSIGVNSLPD